MTDLKERLLAYYGFTEEDYARLSREPSFSALPKLNDDLAAIAAKSRIMRAIEAKEKILVYGDFDTDGIMATSILIRTFHLLGKSASFYIPSRYLDGYGLTMDNAKKIAKAGYSLVILVDNGVSCLQEVSYLLSQGIETIIIDHHELPSSVLPPALATIHPALLPYGDYPVSAGYLCFMFACFLLERLDEYLLTLGAISTISDCMPLHGHNREIVALALRAIRKNNYPEIMMLTDRALIDENVLSMTVVPAINAVGRIVEDATISRVVHYFSDMAADKKPALATWMREVNEARKEATKTALERLRPEPGDPAVVVVGRVKPGLNGLIANRMLQEYGKPVAVFSASSTEPDAYVGSIRSKEGCNVMEFLKGIPELIVKGGGHDYAAGISIKKDDYDRFKQAFCSFAFRHPFVKKEIPAIPMTLSEVTMDSYRVIRTFGPFGHDYEEPRFVLENLPVISLQWTRNGKMLSSPLGKGVRLFSFSYGKPSFIGPDDTVSLLGVLRLEDYQGQVNLTMRCEKAP